MPGGPHYTRGAFGFIAAGRSYLVDKPTRMHPSDAPVEMLESLMPHVKVWGDQYGQDVRRRLRERHFLCDADGYTSFSDPSNWKQPPPPRDAFEQFVKSLMNSRSDSSGKPGISARYGAELIKAVSADPSDSTSDEYVVALAHNLNSREEYLEKLLTCAATTLTRPDQWSDYEYVFVVDLDCDAVALLATTEVDEQAYRYGWDVVSCASLSSADEARDMLLDLSAPNHRRCYDMHRPMLPDMSEAELFRWRKAVARRQRLGGAVLRSFETARCGAALGRPPGWPPLADRYTYPADEDPSLLSLRHQFPEERTQWRVEEEQLAAETCGGTDDDTLDDLLSAELNISCFYDPSDGLGRIEERTAVALRKKKELVTDLKLTPQQYKDIMFWKRLGRHTNQWIANEVGVKEWKVQKLTRGMPGKQRSRR